MTIESVDDQSSVKFLSMLTKEVTEFMKNRYRAEIGCFHAATFYRKEEKRWAQLCYVNRIRKAGRQPGASFRHNHTFSLLSIVTCQIQSSSPDEYIDREMVILLYGIL